MSTIRHFNFISVSNFIGCKGENGDGHIFGTKMCFSFFRVWDGGVFSAEFRARRSIRNNYQVLALMIKCCISCVTISFSMH